MCSIFALDLLSAASACARCGSNGPCREQARHSSVLSSLTPVQSSQVWSAFLISPALGLRSGGGVRGIMLAGVKTSNSTWPFVATLMYFAQDSKEPLLGSLDSLGQ